MGKSILKIYDDGEFWLDGKKQAKLYENGEIWADGKKIAMLYENGDIWMDGKKIGSCTSDGNLWINDRKVASGVYLLSVIEGSPKNPQQPAHQEYSYSASAPKAKPKSTIGDLDGFGMILFCASILLAVAALIACFKLWITDMPEVLTGHLQSTGLRVAALVSVYGCMVFLLYLHWDIATRKNKVMFFGGLLMQGCAFLVNLLLFTVLDMCATAASYGISAFDALGELGKVTGFGSSGGLLGIVATVVIFGLAPTILGALINKIYLKIKGSREGTPATGMVSALKCVPTRIKDAFRSVNPKEPKSGRSTYKASNSDNSTYHSQNKTSNTQTARNDNSVTFDGLFGKSDMKFTATHKVTAEKLADETKAKANMRIVNCTCGTKFRYPTDKGSIIVACPGCKKQYRYFPKR